MFEDLDADVLAELMKLDEPLTLRKETRLSDLLACLEQAATECRTSATVGSISFGSAEQVAVGINSAQRIVEKIWNDKVVA